jgi:AraC-like DNA-binding protein
LQRYWRSRRRICGVRIWGCGYHPVSAVERYEQAFGAPVRFDRDAALLRAPVSLLARTLDGVDDMLRTLALAYLERQPRVAGQVVTGRVRAILDQSLGTGSIELVDLAKVMAVHPRTLQRQLDSEGTSFASILDGVRRARARIYLTTTRATDALRAALVGTHTHGAAPTGARRGGVAQQLKHGQNHASRISSVVRSNRPRRSSWGAILGSS